MEINSISYFFCKNYSLDWKQSSFAPQGTKIKQRDKFTLPHLIVLRSFWLWKAIKIDDSNQDSKFTEWSLFLICEIFHIFSITTLWLRKAAHLYGFNLFSFPGHVYQFYPRAQYIPLHQMKCNVYILTIFIQLET